MCQHTDAKYDDYCVVGVDDDGIDRVDMCRYC